MNYIYWNKLVADTLFTPSRRNQEVFLYLTQNHITEAVKKDAASPTAQPAIIELASRSEKEILADFWKALKDGPLFWRDSSPSVQEYWVGGSDKKARSLRAAPINPAQRARYAFEDWMKAPLSHSATGSRQFYYEQGSLSQFVPLHLLYLACFIMPFSMVKEPPQINKSYDIWKNFFFDKKLIGKKDDFSNNSLTQLGAVWPAMWEELARWSQQELGGERGILLVRQLGSFAYVGWPQSQFLLPPTVLRHLPKFFGYHHLLPGSQLSTAEMRKLLLNPGPLVLPNATTKELHNDSVLGKALTDIVLRKLRTWSGSTSYRERKQVVRNGISQTEEVIHRGNTYGTLLPFLPIDLAETEVLNWSYRLSIRTALPDNLTIVVSGQSPQAVQPASAEWSCEVAGIVPNAELQEFHDSLNSWTLRAKLNSLQVFVPGGRYGFYQHWVPIPALEQGTELLILCEQSLLNDVRQLAQAANSFCDWSDFAGLPKAYGLFWLSNLPSGTTAFSGIPVAAETYIRVQGGLDCGHRVFLAGLPPGFRLINGPADQQLGYTLLHNDQTTSLLPDTRAAHDHGAWLLPANIMVGEQFRITGIGAAQLATLPFNLQEPALPAAYNAPLRGPRGEVADSAHDKVVYNGTCLTGPKAPLYDLHQKNQVIASEFKPVASFGHLASATANFQEVAFGNISNDLLLHYLTRVSKLTNQEFGEALQTVHDARRLTHPAAAHYPTPTTADRQAALRLYSQLGFGDYDSLAGSIQVLPPALLRLPIAGSAGRRMLLTGARTPALMRQLDATAEQCGVRLTRNSQYDGQLIWKSLADAGSTLSEATTQAFRQLLPDRVELFAEGSPAQGYGDQLLKDLAAQCGIEFCPDIVPANLLYFSGSLQEYHAGLVPYTEELPTDWKQSWFDPQTLKWQPGSGDRSTFCLAEFEFRVYRRQCILWQNGIPYAVDKSWGRYLTLQHINKQVLRYNRSTQLLKVPAAVPFPELSARAVVLLSGFSPTLEWNEIEKRRYNVYQTGNTYHLLHNQLPSVLGQTLHLI